MTIFRIIKQTHQAFSFFRKEEMLRWIRLIMLLPPASHKVFEFSFLRVNAWKSYSFPKQSRRVADKPPFRTQGFHRGFDKRKQCVKMADVYGIEKIWSGIYEACRQHGDFALERSKIFMHLLSRMRSQKLCATLVEAA